MSVTNEEQGLSSDGGSGQTVVGSSSSTNLSTTTTTSTPATITTNTSINNSSSINLSGFFDNNEGITNYHNSTSTSTPPQTTISTNSITTGSSNTIAVDEDNVVKAGYLRKYKGRKKFFVLRKETENGPARLEYYANERKFKLGQLPRKSIVLKHCFNINRTDSKYKYAIALHTRNDCVRIQMNSELEMNDWLRLMNYYSGEEELEDVSSTTGTTKPHFEHVWLVTALNKGLGSQENILGSYRLCLTSKELTLLKVGDHDEKNSVLKFPLNVIRNVSHDAAFGCFFHIEFGRFACTGAGKLSLKTEDNNIGQNMHMLILKAWQNYSKDEQIPKNSRDRTNTWNSSFSSTYGQPRSGSFSITPPGVLPRIHSVDGSVGRVRTESMSSSSTERHQHISMSPPVPIHTPTPSMSYSTVGLGSTDSASSSVSDYGDNNNNSGGGYSKSQDDDESYVPWNPTSNDIQPGIHSLTLPLHSDQGDYVETSLGNTNGTPSSSYMEMQSPMSPYDACNYMPMSPSGAGAMIVGNGSVKSGGKQSVSHSRNSSILVNSNSSSTTGLDEAYLDMDFSRKLNLSNDDVRRMSPASSTSETQSSDYPGLEKVSSYLQTDDFEDGSIAMRPTRAYSVGSRSDTSSIGGGKSRIGKNRLEAVQEMRVRAMSVGSKQPPRSKVVNPSSSNVCGLSTISISSMVAPTRSGTPLSSSWSGSTGRWRVPSTSSSQQQPQLPITGQNSSSVYPHMHHQDSADSADLMLLDFSKVNKQKSRKRSLPGPGGNLSSSSSTGSATALQISPCSRNLVGNETIETPSANYSGSASPRYATSAPISIQKNINKSHEIGAGGGFLDSSSSILTRLSGLDVKKLKELDDDGAYYIDMQPGVFSTTTTTSYNNNNNINNNPMTATTSSSTSNNNSGVTITKSPLSIIKPLSAAASSVSSSSIIAVVVPNPSNDKLSKSDQVTASNTRDPNSTVIDKGNENKINTNCSSSSSNNNQQPSLSRSLSSSSNISVTSNSSTTSTTSCVSVKSQPQQQNAPSSSNTERSVSLTLNLSSSTQSTTPSIITSSTSATIVTPTTNSSNLLSRIEESPETRTVVSLQL